MQKRQHYHTDCDYFFSNGAVKYCGYSHGYKRCTEFSKCPMHEEQKKEKKIDWVALVEATIKF